MERPPSAVGLRQGMKRFNAVTALDDVAFTAADGELIAFDVSATQGYHSR